ncbi:MAG: nickel pincer cofactor biosynthesis protein LarC, partial [Dehalococcoidia bacterium]
VEVNVHHVTRGHIAGVRVEFVAPHAPTPLSPSEITGAIQQSGLPTSARQWALEAWQAILDAEAKVHHADPKDVHLEELGDPDTVLDITSAAVIVEALGRPQFYVPSVTLGTGMVRTRAGLLPVPAPATAELLKGFPTAAGTVKGELATPTGAAILRTLHPSFRWPEARWTDIGYGAGTRETEVPNVLRVLVGEEEVKSEAEEIVLLLTDMDDMNPEYFPYVQELLLKAGALDVSAETLLMKKGRPGLRIQVMTLPALQDTLTDILFRETTTLGVRFIPAKRKVLTRKMQRVRTAYGTVKVKVGLLNETVVNVAPEHEDCLRLAKATGTPLKVVYQAALAAAGDELHP